MKNIINDFSCFKSYSTEKFSDFRGSVSVIYENLHLLDSVSLKRSNSKPFVFRGMHIQLPTAPQVKYIEVLEGSIYDICLNLDKNAPDFGVFRYVEMDSRDGLIFEIPKSYAHGFISQTDVVFQYLCVGEYSPDNEIAICPPDFLFDEIGLTRNNLSISPKDLKGMSFDEVLDYAKNVEWD